MNPDAIVTIAGRELRSLFVSPLAWTAWAVVQGLCGYFFLISLDLFTQLQPQLPGQPGAPGITAIVVAPLLKSSCFILLLVSPLLTMRLLSEEKRQGTLRLLLCAPISVCDIVLGKFLGIMGFFLLLSLGIALMPLTLTLAGPLDIGLFGSGFLGLVLLQASIAAIGLFMSSLSSHPATAALGSFAVLFGLWLLRFAGDAGSGGTQAVLVYLSLVTHLDPLVQGVFDTRNLLYFVLLVTTFLSLTVRRLDANRLFG